MTRSFSPEVEDAIRGIRANFKPRSVMVFDKRREWGGVLVKAGGETWVISPEGNISRVSVGDDRGVV